MPIRLAIVDGHTLTRYGLRELMSQQPDIEIVAESGSAAAARADIWRTRPDVVTVDVSLPDGNGLRLAREFRDGDAGLGIVLLTSQEEDDVLFRALETGVSAFVAKSAPVEEVLAAIRHAAVAASSFTAAGLAVALARRRAVTDRVALSPQQAEVLRLLSAGLSIPAIAATMFISQSTAKTYVARLYEKLGVANRAQALMAAMQLGLIRHEHGARADHRAPTDMTPTLPGKRRTTNRVTTPTDRVTASALFPSNGRCREEATLVSAPGRLAGFLGELLRADRPRVIALADSLPRPRSWRITRSVSSILQRSRRSSSQTSSTSYRPGRRRGPGEPRAVRADPRRQPVERVLSGNLHAAADRRGPQAGRQLALASSRRGRPSWSSASQSPAISVAPITEREAP